MHVGTIVACARRYHNLIKHNGVVSTPPFVRINALAMSLTLQVQSCKHYDLQTVDHLVSLPESHLLQTLFELIQPNGGEGVDSALQFHPFCVDVGRAWAYSAGSSLLQLMHAMESSLHTMWITCC